MALEQYRSYFIDAESGNDNNAGTQPLPWKTAVPLNALAITDGTRKLRVFYRLNTAGTWTDITKAFPLLQGLQNVNNLPALSEMTF